MQVVEKFVSINGESTKAGELAAFIRFKGCNLNCTYCDTAWANKPDAPCEELTSDMICAYVREAQAVNVTLTGGEPLLQSDIDELINKLLEDNRLQVEIETNGAVPIMGHIEAWGPLSDRVSLTLDYKLISSGMEQKMCLDNYAHIRANDSVKFVVGSTCDLTRAHHIIKEYDLTDRCNVYLSPVYGKIEPVTIVDYMKRHSLNKVRLCLQLHKIIWPADTRGV